MTELIKYSRIGEQDLALQSATGDTTFSVVLPDGRQVTLDKISLESFTAYGDVNFNLQEANNLLLEILTSNPSTNTKGRIFYFDTTDDQIRYMDGTNVRTLCDLAIAQTLTNKTLTDPVISQIIDSNGNELLELTLVASAVNYLDIVNAVTGGDVIIRAEGDDDNVDLDLQSKGTGAVLVNGNTVASFPTATQGNVLYYSGSAWVVLSTPNHDGSFLQTQGVSANPRWAMPRGYIDGLLLSRDTDTAHDIQIGTGMCAADDSLACLQLTSVLTKQIDANWAVGDDAGGFPSALTLTADTWYHVFLIETSAAGVVDAGFDTSTTATNLLSDSGGTRYRRIGSILTDGSSNVTAFTQIGNVFRWDVPVSDVATANPGTSVVAFTTTTPDGIATRPILAIVYLDISIASDAFLLLTENGQTDTAPTATLKHAYMEFNATDSDSSSSVVVSHLYTNTSRSMNYRVSDSTADHTVRIMTGGWTDDRGQNA